MYFLVRNDNGGISERMRLTSSGNLGLGVTPSAWGSGYRALQVGPTSALFEVSSLTILSNNQYYNGGDLYLTSDFASRYVQYDGMHIWATAPSGTAGNAISFTQAMTLDASGNLMVGTTSAVGRLTVQQSTDATNGGISIFAVNGEGAIISRLNDGGLTFRNGGEERMRITSGGNVGIGTTPSYRLDVRQVTTDPVAFFGFSQTSSSSNGLIKLNSGRIPQGGSDFTGESGVIFGHSGGTMGVNFDGQGGYIKSIRVNTYAASAQSDSDLVFATALDNVDYERMRITSGGNVGIGTDSPNYPVEVRKSGGLWSTSGNDFGAVLGVYFNTANTGGTQNRFRILADQNAVYLDGYDAFPLIFRNNGNTERLRITSEGYLGTTVTGDTITSGDLLGVLSFVSRDASTYSSGGITNIRSYATSTYNTGNVAGDLRFYVSDGLQNTTGTYLFGTEAMRITSPGYVYINAQSNPLPDNAQPQFALTGGADTDAVAIKHTANGNNTLNIWQTGTTQHNAIAFYKGDTQANRGNIVVTTSGTSYNSVSDYRLKENITPLENGLDRVLQLKPSKFNWIETGNETEGFIAHELQEYFPDAVTGEKDAVYSSTGNIKPQSVDYGRITPLLVKAIQELKAENDALKEILQRNNIS
jgi:hypothetical protein